MPDSVAPSSASPSGASTRPARAAGAAGAAEPASSPGRAPGAGMDRRVAPSRMRRLRPYLRYGAGVLVLAVGLAAWRLVPASGSLAVAQDDLAIDTVHVQPFLDYLPVRATVAPLHVTFLGAVQGGQVASVAVPDGILVHPGDVLARLTNPQLELDVSTREAAIAGQLGDLSAQRLALQQSQTGEDGTIAEASYNLLKAGHELAIRRQLLAQGFESDANVKTFADEDAYYAGRLALLRAARQKDRAVAQAQARELDGTAERLRHTLAAVEDSLSSLTLRAPVAGRLTNFTLQPGQTLKAGDPIGQIDSEGAWRLDADIDEFYLARVAVGEHGIAQIDGHDVPFTVARVHPQITAGQFRAELTFDTTPPAALRRGESVECRLTLGRTRQALIAPNGAWLDGSGGNSVFVVSADGHHATRRAISVGGRNPEQVEITAGLRDGERIVTSAYTNFHDFNQLLIR
ncbi:efflux RND transporter periplasmic adaptor subunit [Nguyenibacter sp. L1]|uniref:efflux RND transporter periplasmic adaptor subunit n=1 Tax=Nguyenibacter sp. L1 TaxID=3049350 RepID=UPI002B47AA75|nr:efflux RND transporter periplasmic adaptor subunit [Nguyenibacter sp. L1]WRH89446.1 efflux RND transporter periplasmic adaptor subunit [Nguyenibacter sp. L1]